MIFKYFLIVLVAVAVAAFKLPAVSRIVRPTDQISSSLKSLTLLSPTVLMIPTVCLADEGTNQGAFLIPLAISVLTIFPFLYYQQQLKPKPRSVKQIELDENLKPKSKSGGGTVNSQPKAGKKK